MKNPPAMQEMWVRSLDRKDPLKKKKKIAATTVFSPGKSMDRGAWQVTLHGAAKESYTT